MFKHFRKLEKSICFTAAFVLLAGLLLASTLAWSDSLQHKSNKFYGQGKNPASELLVRKVVEGEGGDTNLEFSFVLTVTQNGASAATKASIELPPGGVPDWQAISQDAEGRANYMHAGSQDMVALEESAIEEAATEYAALEAAAEATLETAAAEGAALEAAAAEGAALEAAAGAALETAASEGAALEAAALEAAAAEEAALETAAAGEVAAEDAATGTGPDISGVAPEAGAAARHEEEHPQDGFAASEGLVEISRSDGGEGFTPMDGGSGPLKTTYRFTLKHNTERVFPLPPGATYDIDEINVPTGYNKSFTVSKSESGVLIITFTNTYGDAPEPPKPPTPTPPGIVSPPGIATPPGIVSPPGIATPPGVTPPGSGTVPEPPVPPGLGIIPEPPDGSKPPVDPDDPLFNIDDDDAARGNKTIEGGATGKTPKTSDPAQFWLRISTIVIGSFLLRFFLLGGRRRKHRKEQA